MIRCDLHDYIEIACLYRLPIELHFLEGDSVTGVAEDTTYNDEKQECVVLRVKAHKRLIPMDALSSMRAVTKNPHFDFVEFK